MTKLIASWRPLGRQQPTYRAEAFVAAERAAVYDALADPEKRIVWDPGLAKVEVLQRNERGPLEWRTTNNQGVTMRFLATARVSPYALGLSARREGHDEDPIGMRFSYGFMEEGGGTRIRVALTLDGVLDDLVVHLAVRMLGFFKMRDFVQREAATISAFCCVDEIATIARIDAADARP